MNWRIKGVIQGALSVLPGGEWVNDRLQRTLGELRDFDGHIHRKVTGDWLILASHMRELDRSMHDLDYVEVGTGWFPVLPICYSLVGARSVTTFDVRRHLDANLTFQALRSLESHIPAIAEAGSRPMAEVRADFAGLSKASSIDQLLERARIRYIAPGDASATGLASASVDVVFSNSVLEHVPAEVIERIMQESARILRPNGLAIHSVNCGDHYAYFDRSITMINYLTYSENAWRRWNTRLLYQNRMRPGDFLCSAERSGLEVVLERSKPRPELLAALSSLKIAPEFEQYPREQLASTSVDFAARRPC